MSISPVFAAKRLRTIMKPCFDDTIRTMLCNIDHLIQTNAVSTETKSTIHDVKSLFDAFTLDSLIQSAFNVKIDSLNDHTHPILVNLRSILQTEIKFVDALQIVLLFFAPRVAKLFKIEFKRKEIQFFAKLSSDIMERKRAEFAAAGSYTNAQTFIDFMLEAEDEFKRMEQNRSDANNEKAEKKSTKCKSTSICCCVVLIPYFCNLFFSFDDG